MKNCDFLSIDTEFMHSKNFYAEPALLQIKFDDQILLIDLVKIKNKDLIKSILKIEKAKKLIHAGSEDLQIFYHSYDVNLENFFDTQIMAHWLLDKKDSAPKFSYGKLVNLVAGIELEKSQTRSDWLKRPLDEKQKNYAAEDVEYLFSIFKYLKNQQKSGEKIVFEDINLSFFEIAKIESDYSARNISRVNKYARDYRLYDQNGKFSREELAHLCALNDWRLEAAKLHNLPVRWVLPDKNMINLVKKKALYKKDFLESDFVNSFFVRKYGKILLNLLDQNLKNLDKFNQIIPKKDKKIKNLTGAWSKAIEEFEKSFYIRENSLISGKIKYLMLLDYLKTGTMARSYNLTDWRFKVAKSLFNLKF